MHNGILLLEVLMYKFVQINELVIDYCEDKELREFFSEVLALRLRGYRENYGELSVPLDAFDLIGTHLVLAKVEQSKLTPISCIRSVTQEQATKYGHNFPFLDHMFPEGNGHLAESCTEFINTHSNVCYTNNYTMISNMSDEQKEFVGMMSFSFYYNYHKENNICNFITAASDKFKVYRSRLAVGYEYINDNSEFSTFQADHIMGEKFRAMKMTEFSQLSKSLGAKFNSMFEDRLIFGKEHLNKEKKAA